MFLKHRIFKQYCLKMQKYNIYIYPTHHLITKYAIKSIISPTITAITNFQLQLKKLYILVSHPIQEHPLVAFK